MEDQSPFDRRSIVVASVAILAFMLLGAAIAAFGGADESAAVSTAGPTSTTQPVERTTVTSSTTTTTAAPPAIEIPFESHPGLGFEHDRTWTYDPASKTLVNVSEFTTDRKDLTLRYVELLPPSVTGLGKFEFDPQTDDVVTGDDGSKRYIFELDASAGAPGVLRWAVVTEKVLTAKDLDVLADDQVAASPD